MKKRKQYKPKPVNVLAFEKAIRLTKPVNEDAKIQLALDNRTAIEAFAIGKADRAHFDTLASTVDVSLMLLDNVFTDADELKAEVKLGWQGMVRARERLIASGKLGLDGQAYNALKRVCDIYESIIENVTGAELLKYYKAREDAIRAGNFYKGKVAA